MGIALVTAGSSVLNQALERKTDLRMPRTAARPMAQGRVGLAHGLLLGFALVAGGSLYLALTTNLITGTLTLLTAVSYVAIYTPLKRLTSLNTFVGAFPGALPPLIGWTAAFFVLLMIPVSLWPTALHITGLPYALLALLLDAYYLWATLRFARIMRAPESAENRKLAKGLLKVSVIYLPLLLLAMVLNAQGRLLLR